MDSIHLVGGVTGGQGAINHTWVCDNGFTANTQNAAFKSGSGTADITCYYQATDAVGCIFQDTVVVQIYDVPAIYVLQIDTCVITEVLVVNDGMICSKVLQEKIEGVWTDIAGTLPFTVPNSSMYRLKVICTCGTYYSNEVQGDCGVDCSTTGLSVNCNFNEGASTLQLTSTGTPDGTITSDVLQWRKVNPTTGGPVTSFANYTTTLTASQISEYFIPTWRVCEIYGGSSNNINFGFSAISSSQAGGITSGTYNWGATNISISAGTTSYADGWGVGALNTYEPFGFTVNKSTPLGTITATGSWTYSGSGSAPITCPQIIFVSSNSGPKYYNIEWRRIIQRTECDPDTVSGFCTLAACNSVTLSVGFSGSTLTATGSGCTGPATYTFVNSTTGQTLQSGSSNTLSNVGDGTYTVTLSCGGCVKTEVEVVNTGCLVSGTATLSGSCNLLVSSVNNCASYTLQWYKDGVLIPGATSASYTATGVGIYYAVINCVGCSGGVQTNQVNVTSCNTCSASVNINRSGCTLTAVVNNCGGTPSYLWSTGATTQSINAGTDGTYSVTVSGCCQGLNDSEVVTGCSNPCTSFNWTHNAPSSICKPNSATITASPSGGASPYTYNWKIGTTTVGTSQSYTLNSNSFSDGILTLIGTVTDANGCQNAKTININIQTCTVPCTGYTVGVTPLNPTVCQNVSQNFFSTIGNGTSPYTYEWKVGSTIVGTSANLAYTFTSTGTFTVSCKVTDSNGCMATGTTQVTVNNCSCQVQITNLTSNPTCGQFTGTWASSGGSSTTVQWAYSSGSSCTGASGWTAISNTFVTTTANPDGTGTSTVNLPSIAQGHCIRFLVDGTVNNCGTASQQIFGPVCDACAGLNLTLDYTTGPAKLGWGTLKSNGVTVTNYLISWRLNGVEQFRSAAGSYYNASTTYAHPLASIPVAAGNWTAVILNSSVGDNLTCLPGVTINPITCADGTQFVNYNAAGGISSVQKITFYITSSTNILLNWYTQSVPDILRVKYNGVTTVLDPGTVGIQLFTRNYRHPITFVSGQNEVTIEMENTNPSITTQYQLRAKCCGPATSCPISPNPMPTPNITPIFSGCNLFFNYTMPYRDDWNNNGISPNNYFNEFCLDVTSANFDILNSVSASIGCNAPNFPVNSTCYDAGTIAVTRTGTTVSVVFSDAGTYSTFKGIVTSAFPTYLYLSVIVRLSNCGSDGSQRPLLIFRDFITGWNDGTRTLTMNYASNPYVNSCTTCSQVQYSAFQNAAVTTSDTYEGFFTITGFTGGQTTGSSSFTFNNQLVTECGTLLRKYQVSYLDMGCPSISYQLKEDVDNNGSYETLLYTSPTWTGSCP